MPVQEYLQKDRVQVRKASLRCFINAKVIVFEYYTHADCLNSEVVIPLRQQLKYFSNYHS